MAPGVVRGPPRRNRIETAISEAALLEAMDHGGGRYDDAYRRAESDCTENFAHGAR